MDQYRLEIESDGNLGIYCSRPEVWIGNILDAESPNPALVLEIPIGILGMESILHLFKKWKAGHGSTGGNAPSSRRSTKYRSATRKWRQAYRAKFRR